MNISNVRRPVTPGCDQLKLRYKVTG